jgi:hypothetical protein
MITPFRIIPMVDAQTTSITYVDLLTVSDVLVSHAGNILVDVDVSIEIIPAAALEFKGAILQFLWDEATLPGEPTAWFEYDAYSESTAFNTFSSCLKLRALIAATVGTHVLKVQWASVAPTASDTLVAFAGDGCLTIEGKG